MKAQTAHDTGFERLIAIVVQRIVAGASAADVQELAVQLGSQLLPDITSNAPDPAQGAAILRAMARQIWQQTPQPQFNFAVRRLPQPGRNDVCSCGSTRKYKHCCEQLDRGLPMDHLNLLPQVLACLPRKRWGELVNSAIPADQLAHTAAEMVEAGDARKAIALLEPWFAGTLPISAKLEWPLDMLIDAYWAAGQPGKKRSLLNDALARGDRTIRASALQRLATMAADAGDQTTAWSLFHDARREQPDSPSLSHLEVTLLLAEGKTRLAQERARFWIARLRRQQDHPRELLEFLEDVASRGEEAVFAIEAERNPSLGRLAALLAAAPAPDCLYRLDHGDSQSAGRLLANRRLAAAESRWRRAFGDAETCWEHADRWLDLLEGAAPLWHSFDVLGDLFDAGKALRALGCESQLFAPLLCRVEPLLRTVLAANAANGKCLEWGWIENRPALRLLADAIMETLEGPQALAALRSLEWMVGELNPNDNQGMRAVLMQAYLDGGHYEDALALQRRYPEDFLVEVCFGGVLSLFALDRREEATRMLVAASRNKPKVVPMLLSASPRKPKLNPSGVKVGGSDEAWLYRERARALWQRLGALEWLRENADRRRVPRG